jgi:ABC-2 type transport system permease protein
MTTVTFYPDRLPLFSRLTDSVVIARRGLLGTFRTPQAAVPALISPILFLVLFRFVFGGAIHIPGLTYVDYLVPAMLIQNIVFGGMNSATGLALDARDGILDRFRSLPTPRSAAITGRGLSDLALQLVAHLLTIVAGIAIGFRLHVGPGSCLAALGLLLLIGASLFWVFAAMGLATRNPQTVQSMTPPFFLFLFVSSAFIPVSTLPIWLQGFASNQPVTVFTDALRGLTQGPSAQQATGHSAEYFVIASLAWCAAITTLFAAAAMRSYKKM